MSVADHLRELGGRMPDAYAVITPGARCRDGLRTYARVTFSELEQAVDRYARGLRRMGVRQDTRCLVLVRPSEEFFGLVFALFRLGAIPVLIDPRMEREHVLGAIREVEPEVLIAVPKVHALSLLFPRVFSRTRIRITVGRRWFWGGVTSKDVEALGRDPDQRGFEPIAFDEAAAILFTSGSTGAPKGVIYTHGIFEEQLRIFREDFGIQAGEVDLSAFPLFSLFSCALGVTSVIPDMDPTRPATVDPHLIVEAIRDLGVTYSFGSPAFWRPIAAHCEEHGIEMSTLRRVFMAGAPASVELLERLARILPARSDVYTPYGATECLPITAPTARAILSGPAVHTERGAGTYVGRPVGRTEVRIIRIVDRPIPTLRDAEMLPARAIGEIIVRGPVATKGYFRRPEDDAASKIRDETDLWHRMGDVGYLDEDGALWFCGRKSQRVETSSGVMFTERCEAIFNRHPGVARTALVGVGPRGLERPVIIAEMKRRGDVSEEPPLLRHHQERIREELLHLGRSSPLTESIRDVLFHPAFPVDPRHNAKIIREKLALFAARELPRRGGGVTAHRIVDPSK